MRLFDETPGMGILRNFLYAVIITIVYLGVLMILWRFDAGLLPAYMLAGAGFAFLGWGGERLWYAAMPGFFRNPDGWKAVCSRIPYWGLFGGMGYTAAFIVSKKLGWIQIDEIPVKNFFYTGAGIGTVIQFSLLLLARRVYPFQITIQKKAQSL